LQRALPGASPSEIVERVRSSPLRPTKLVSATGRLVRPLSGDAFGEGRSGCIVDALANTGATPFVSGADRRGEIWLASLVHTRGSVKPSARVVRFRAGLAHRAGAAGEPSIIGLSCGHV